MSNQPVSNHVVHELKTWPEFFEEVVSLRKRFEIRQNDRNYQVGDVLHLREYRLGAGYTGREVKQRVTYLTDWKQHGNYIVMSLSDAPIE